MYVVKFGGSSIADATAIRRVVQIIARQPEPTVVVLSALGTTTDSLERAGSVAAAGDGNAALSIVTDLEDRHLDAIHGLELPPSMAAPARRQVASVLDTARQLVTGIAVLSDLSPSVRARLLACGEQLSTRIIHWALRAVGLPAQWFDSRELVVTRDGDPECAEPDAALTADRCAEMISPALDQGIIPVLQGFVGCSTTGQTTLLGRGGSDCTASLVGAVLGAERIDIWTDVDGILTADPTLVPEASVVAEMTFAEAAELAFFGARVLHPKTLVPAVRAGIPIRVRNTQRPQATGTTICSSAVATGAIKSIAYKENITLIRLVSERMFRSTSYLAAVFDRFERAGVTPDAVATTEVSAAVAVCDPPPLDHLMEQLSLLGTVTATFEQALVCIVGDGIRSQPGLVARVFDDLADIPIAMVSQGGSELALAFVVSEDDLTRVVRRLHRRFFAGGAVSNATRTAVSPSAPLLRRILPDSHPRAL